MDKLNWYKKLYVGDTLSGRPLRTRWAVNHGSPPSDLKLITLASNGRNLLDIRPAEDMKKPFWRRSCPMIVGIAQGQEEAIGLVVRIVDEAYQTLGSTDVRAYLAMRVRE